MKITYQYNHAENYKKKSYFNTSFKTQQKNVIFIVQILQFLGHEEQFFLFSFIEGK